MVARSWTDQANAACCPRAARPLRPMLRPRVTRTDGVARYIGGAIAMPQQVQYPADIEPLVQFIEDTPRSEIIDKTLQKLRAGVPTKTMLTASALAVTRSSDLPPGHHGGPLHPLAGLYALTKLVDRLEGEEKFLPVVQHVALSNKHIHDPVTGPYRLL